MAHGLHALQLRLLLRGLQLLLPGGRLVYSTCSLNPIENEAVVAAALARMRLPVRLVPSAAELPGLKRMGGLARWRVSHGGALYASFAELPEDARLGRGGPLPSMFPPEATAAAAMGLEQCLRVLPHMQDTGGFFIAVFERLGGEGAEQDEEDEVEVSSVARLLATVPRLVRPVIFEAEQVGHAAEDEAAAEPKAAAPAAAAASVAQLLSTAPCLVRTGADAEAAAAAAETGAAPGGVYGNANQRGAAQGAHVLAPLHAAPSNQGKYDTVYGLRPWWLQECAAWWGLPEASPPLQQMVTQRVDGAPPPLSEDSAPPARLVAPSAQAAPTDSRAPPRQLGGWPWPPQLGAACAQDEVWTPLYQVSRSVTGHSIVMVAAPILSLLRADATVKLQLVNTGVRVLERSEFKCDAFGWRLAQAERRAHNAARPA